MPATLAPPAKDILADQLRRALGVTDDPEFNALTGAAARLIGCPMALVSLVWRDRLWFKSKVGVEMDDMPLDQSLCRFAVEGDAPLVVPDLAGDPTYADLSIVNADAGLRFYAGIPLRVPCGSDGRMVPVGTFCVAGPHVQTLTGDEIAILDGLAGVAEALLTARLTAIRAADDAAALAEALMAQDRLHRQFRQAERMANVGSWRLTLADNHVEWSEQIYHIHEVPAGRGEPLDDALSFYPPRYRAIIEQAVQRAIATGQPYDIEVDLVTAKGRPRRVRAMGEVELQDGVPVALIGVFQDITARHRLEQALEHRANTDELTRIASRGRFNVVLDEAIAAAQHDGRPLAIVLVDLDQFKEANDRCGHPAGDEVLRRAASALQAPWLGDSLAARLGGDEFALVVTEPALVATLPALLGRLLGEMVQMAEGGGHAVPVGATLGACRFGPEAPDRKGLLERADAALYAAKRSRRGTAAIAGLPGFIRARPIDSSMAVGRAA